MGPSEEKGETSKRRERDKKLIGGENKSEGEVMVAGKFAKRKERGLPPIWRERGETMIEYLYKKKVSGKKKGSKAII